MTKPVVVLTSVDTEDLGSSIASSLVDKRLAACVNLIPGVRSFYRWQGKVCRDDELMLMIKTTTDRLEQVYSAVRELHSYELPELVAVEIENGEPSFLQWLIQSVEGSDET